MMAHNSEDVFTADRYPEMVQELKLLKEDARQMPVYFKGEIIVSYLKKHSINSEWITANPKLVKFIRNYAAATTHIESLFEFYRLRRETLGSYEKYLKKFLTTA